MYDLYQKLFTISLGDKSVTKLFIELRGVLQELGNFHPLSTDLAAIRRKENQLNVCQFLDALGPKFEAVSAQILSVGGDLTLEKVYNRVLNAESTILSLSNNSTTTETTAALNSSSNWSRGDSSTEGNGGGSSSCGHSRGRGRGERKCMHCGRTNHISEKCWEKFRKPAWANSVEKSESLSNPLSIAQDAMQKLFQHLGQLQLVSTPSTGSSSRHLPIPLLLVQVYLHSKHLLLPHGSLIQVRRVTC